MSETFDVQLDQEIHQLEVETFEIEDLVDAEQTAGACCSTSSTSSTTSCTSCGSCSC